jgi:hypothetical protein
LADFCSVTVFIFQLHCSYRSYLCFCIDDGGKHWEIEYIKLLGQIKG